MGLTGVYTVAADNERGMYMRTVESVYREYRQTRNDVIGGIKIFALVWIVLGVLMFVGVI